MSQPAEEGVGDASRAPVAGRRLRAIGSGLRAEERDRAVRQWLREWEATFEALRDGVIVLDASGRVLRVNRAFRSFFQPELHQVTGLNLEDLLGAHAGRRGRRAAAEVLANPGSTVEFKFRRRWYELTVDPVEPSADVGVGSLVRLADVSAKRMLHEQRLRLRDRTAEARALRKEAEGLARLERMKTRVLNLVSHELRTPITVIGGYLDLLANGDLGERPEAGRQVLPIVSDQVRRLNALIEQILDVARIDDGALKLACERVDLRDVAEIAVAEIRAANWEGSRVTLQTPRAPAFVDVDERRVAGVITELIDNALKYSSEAVLVNVLVQDGQALVHVADTGFGIDAAEQEGVFRRLGRVITRENAHIPGSGLGLHLARQIARSHGGDLVVRSAVGVGSTFTLRLPALPAAGLDLQACDQPR